MHRIFSYAARLAEDAQLFRFQNDLTQIAYDTVFFFRLFLGVPKLIDDEYIAPQKDSV